MLNHHAIAELDRELDQLELEGADDQGALWVWMAPRSRSCFTLDLLMDLSRVSVATQAGRFGPVEHWVLGSRTQGVFNYGGDLELFARAIRQRDRRTLLGYGRICVDLVDRNRTAMGLPMTTVSVIQGDALGGGAEAALSAQVVVAERGVRIGFPEIMFNLFPGMGAFHLMADRIGPAAAEAFLVDGAFHTAEELHEMGLVDVLAEPGEGRAAADDAMAAARARLNGRRGLAVIRTRSSFARYDALVDTVERWVDHALSIGDDSLSLIDHLVARQHAKADGGG